MRLTIASFAVQMLAQVFADCPALESNVSMDYRHAVSQLNRLMCRFAFLLILNLALQIYYQMALKECNRTEFNTISGPRQTFGLMNFHVYLVHAPCFFSFVMFFTDANKYILCTPDCADALLKFGQSYSSCNPQLKSCSKIGKDQCVITPLGIFQKSCPPNSKCSVQPGIKIETGE